MPQAGVALDFALLAKSAFPELGDMLFVTITATTLFYGLIDPIATRYALLRYGDIKV